MARPGLVGVARRHLNSPEGEYPLDVAPWAPPLLTLVLALAIRKVKVEGKAVQVKGKVNIPS